MAVTGQKLPWICEHRASFLFSWKIESFQARMLSGGSKSMTSEKFTITFGTHPTEWTLELKVSSVENVASINNEHLTLYLNHLPDKLGQQKTTHSCSLSLKSATNNDFTKNFTPGTHFSSTGVGTTCGLSQFISVNYLLTRMIDLLPNDTLTIICKGLFSMDIRAVAIDRPVLSSNFLRLLESGAESDTTLVAQGGKEFKVHRLILKAGSPVFAAMFSHDTKESASGRVVFDDIEPLELEAMIRYIYTDQEPPNLPEVATNLMIAAERYDLQRLKTMCEHHLAYTINADNVIPLLNIAIHHNCAQLQDVCCAYAKYNLDEMKKAAYWGLPMVKEYPEATAAVMVYLK